jgi:hypothetical protein
MKQEMIETLARFFGDQDVDTAVIHQAKHFARRRLGGGVGQGLVSSLEKLEKKRASSKEEE